MLILRRKIGERIFIDGRRITLTVVKLGGNSVSIGIDAPRDVTVHREEIQQLADQENRRLQAIGEMVVKEVPEVARIMGLRLDEEWINDLD